jgi:hypothetical protein
MGEFVFGNMDGNFDYEIRKLGKLHRSSAAGEEPNVTNGYFFFFFFFSFL